MRLIEGYTPRILTHKEDSLKALRGVLTSLTASHGIGFYKGIPESYLDAALLFDRAIHNPSSRRKIFPSWSWVGWEGGSRYYGNDIHIVSEVKWHKYFTTIEITWYHEIDNWKIRHGNESDEFQELRSLWKPASPNPGPGQKPEIPPLDIFNIPLLVFQTSSAYLIVDLTGKNSEQSFDNELCNIRCPNDKENVIGQIRIYKEWRLEKSESRLEFIVVARGVSQHNEHSGQKRTGLWTMLIETDERGISQRVQTPTDMIKDADWTRAKPSWRAVYLA
jgi:hypothetical protein